MGGVGAPLERNLSWRAGKTHALLQTGNFSSHAVFLLLTVTDILIFPLQQRTKQHLQTCSLVPIITNFNSSQIQPNLFNMSLRSLEPVSIAVFPSLLFSLLLVFLPPLSFLSYNPYTHLFPLLILLTPLLRM